MRWIVLPFLLAACAGAPSPPGDLPPRDMAVSDAPADAARAVDLSSLGLIDGGYYYSVDGACAPECGGNDACRVPMLGCGSANCSVTAVDAGVCFCYWTCGV